VYSSSGEHSLSGLEYTRSTAWSVEDETAYLARVRDRAGVMATKLLTDARREAEGIKRQAREQGYAKGLADAGKELEAFRIGLGETVGTVLTSIEEQCAHIFEQWKGELTAVARLAVERVCGLELAENRAAILESLLTQSVALLDQRRELAIRVNPEDQAMLEDIVGMAKERFPDVTSWRVKADASITPGGMVVESESSLAEGRLESRRAAVDTVLDRLTLTDLDLPDSLIEPEPE
jgi:flagellar assembly protein FliH